MVAETPQLVVRADFPFVIIRVVVGIAGEIFINSLEFAAGVSGHRIRGS